MLEHARARLGGAYTGDADAPRVEVVSEPRLGLSMGLPDTDEMVWPVLASTAAALAERCDVYAIACNTLNVYAERLGARGLDAHLVSMPAAVRTWAASAEIRDFGLLGAAPVATLTEWSPYRSLTTEFRIERPPDVTALHRLIDDIKTDGGADPALGRRFVDIAAGYASSHLVLACTELPLVATPISGRTLVDPTDLVAVELVRCWTDLAGD